MWLLPLDRHILFSLPPPFLLLYIQPASLNYVNSLSFAKYKTLGEAWPFTDGHELEVGKLFL